MKTTKKIVAMLLALLMMLSVGVVSVSAADDIPVFQASVISETSTQAIIELSLVSGKFACVDFELVLSGNFSKITQIKRADDFNNIIINGTGGDGDALVYSANKDTGKISIASANSFDGNINFYQITISKRANKAVSTSDLTVKVNNCEKYINSIDTKKVTNQVTVLFSLGKIELDNYSLNMNYKQSQQLNVDTKLDKSALVWTSSNEKVATVDDQGKVTTVGTGNAVIKVSNEDGTIFAECNVNSSYSTFQWIIVIVFFGWLWY